MAVMENIRIVSPTNIFGGISNIIGTIAAWNDVRQTRKALSKLSDRELEDIGLARGDIDLIAR